MTLPIIDVRNLSKVYTLGQIGVTSLKEEFERLWNGVRGRVGARVKEPFWALRDISFKVQPGDVIGIIGRNGAGKSTLLKILSRITQQSAGEIALRGRVASLLEVGTGFHPDLTGRENVFLNGAILGMTKAEVRSKLDEIIAFSELEKFIDTPVKRYSSGMYVRLAFAVAAHLEPEILIVDEVLAVGDAAFQKKCLGKMNDVAKRGGRTVLFVSHNMGAIEQLCSRALLLKQGSLAADSSDIHAVVRDYLFEQDDTMPAAEWVNGSDDFDIPWFRPERFRARDARGQTIVEPIRGDTEAWIEIEGTIETLDPSLTFGYAIYGETGDLIYWSYQTDTPQEKWPDLKKGRMVLRSPLPRRFLNEGTYRVDLIGGLHNRQWLFEPGKNVPAFSFRIKGGLSESPHWTEKRPGLLAMVIPWTAGE